MNPDDIYDMFIEAEEWADSEYQVQRFHGHTWDELFRERVVALVAAHEREACARVCETEARMWDSLEVTGRGKDADMAVASLTCAAAIRARGDET